ncbi:MAG: hypothetical protein HPZ00_05025 [Christensenellaceae bacterium]|nr:hypothetical protein [Christensenellaceae bacterium]
MRDYSVSGDFGQVKFYNTGRPSGRYKSAAHILNMGWHRVTVFGDCRKQLMNLFKMKGLKVIQEDKEPVI